VYDQYLPGHERMAKATINEQQTSLPPAETKSVPTKAKPSTELLRVSRAATPNNRRPLQTEL
jgi:hypothetical protein